MRASQHRGHAAQRRWPLVLDVTLKTCEVGRIVLELAAGLGYILKKVFYEVYIMMYVG